MKADPGRAESGDSGRSERRGGEEEAGALFRGAARTAVPRAGDEGAGSSRPSRLRRDSGDYRSKLGVLPRTHGSALFTRGETQALVTATLGTTDDSQRLETFEGEQRKKFMLHYNFPPFSVGETGRMTGVGRREVGHGALAERAISAVLPTEEESPYSLRVVSDILESNGSSSMASVCGASLALMDAGIPLKSSVAGIAMGLVKEGDDYAILTDIAGAEDHYGDMDFKVAGNAERDYRSADGHQDRRHHRARSCAKRWNRRGADGSSCWIRWKRCSTDRGRRSRSSLRRSAPSRFRPTRFAI